MSESETLQDKLTTAMPKPETWQERSARIEKLLMSIEFEVRDVIAELIGDEQIVPTRKSFQKIQRLKRIEEDLTAALGRLRTRIRD
jgi:hypothetical protein